MREHEDFIFSSVLFVHRQEVLHVIHFAANAFTTLLNQINLMDCRIT